MNFLSLLGWNPGDDREKMPIEEVIREARELAADGVKELVIVAQDTTYYGVDLYGEPRLVELLSAALALLAG